jgi:hypothetical protein
MSSELNSGTRRVQNCSEDTRYDCSHWIASNIRILIPISCVACLNSSCLGILRCSRLVRPIAAFSVLVIYLFIVLCPSFFYIGWEVEVGMGKMNSSQVVLQAVTRIIRKPDYRLTLDNTCRCLRFTNSFFIAGSWFILIHLVLSSSHLSPSLSASPKPTARDASYQVILGWAA